MNGYANSDCSVDTQYTQFFFPLEPDTLSTDCIHEPFNDENYVVSVDQKSDTLNYTSFQETNCSGLILVDKSFSNLPFESCFHVNKFGKEIHLSYSISETLPYEESDLIEGFLVCEFYMDKDCNETRGTFETFTSSYSGFSWKYGKYRFTEEYIILHEYEDNTVEILQREKNEGVCQKLYLADDDYSFTKSSIYRLFSGTNAISEMESYYNFPKQSENEYVLQSYSYNSNCSSYYQMSPVTTDKCLDSKSFVTTKDIYVGFQYEFDDYDCEGEYIIFTVIVGEELLFDQCWFFDTDYHNYNDVGLKKFRTMKLSDEPYSPSQIAIVDSYVYKCGDDLVPIMEDPGHTLTARYYDEELCIVTEDLGISQLIELGKSVRGYCSKKDGSLNLKFFQETEDCVGEYETLVFNQEICEERFSGEFYTHILCLPRFCGGVTSLDTENVCNGRGECVKKDVCECFSDQGYSGYLCEDWSCFGVESSVLDYVCSGNGECITPDKCLCGTGYSGIQCERNDLQTFGIIFGSIFIPLTFVSVCLVICCCLFCCLCCCIILTFCGCGTCGLGGISILQRKKLSKFEKLDDFDLILREQMIERDETIAHLKINKKLFEIDYDDIKIEKMIGQGGSDAIVYLAVWRSHVTAFKCFNTRKICSSQNNFNTFEKEVAVLATINHPNIIIFYGASIKPPRVGILMEFCENGEILDFILRFREEEEEEEDQEGKNENQKSYPVSEKIRMCREIISALEYINSKNIIHRDIKPGNILINEMENCKLMDFGISKIVQSVEERGKTRRIGTSLFMAPEVLTGYYDSKCDVFSFSILIYMIFSEIELPYGEIETSNIEYRVANDDEFRPDLSVVELFSEKEYEWIGKVIAKCWKNNPSERYDVHQLSEIFEKEDDNLYNEQTENKVKKLKKKNTNGNQNNNIRSSLRLVQSLKEKEQGEEIFRLKKKCKELMNEIKKLKED